MNKQSYKEYFNIPAQKIVSLSEFEEKKKALYKTNLTIGEKIVLNIIKRPLTAIHLIPFLRTEHKKGADGVFSEIYKETFFDKRTFVSGEAVQKILGPSLKYTANEKFAKKLNDLTSQAFNQCKDNSDMKFPLRAIESLHRPNATLRQILRQTRR